MNRFIYYISYILMILLVIGCHQKKINSLPDLNAASPRLNGHLDGSDSEKDPIINPTQDDQATQSSREDLQPAEIENDQGNDALTSLADASDTVTGPKETMDPGIAAPVLTAPSSLLKELEAAENNEKEKPERDGQSTLDEALEFCDAAQDFWQKGDLDNALEALDKAYSLILKISITDDPKLIQQKEDLRFLISKRILEIYASRNIVVNGNHDAIPMGINRHIQMEIDRFKGPERRFFIASYKRSGKYRPYIIKSLKEAGLPEELSWIPLIESGFKVKALSKARALGLWQFIPSTGYKFGLKRDKYVDERMDPVRSTNAAIDYLKELHNIFGDWSTVLAAYNCGEGRVLRVIRTQNVNYLDDFWDLYQRLPRETARYVPRFLAVLHILKDMKKFGFDHLVADGELVYDEVEIQRQVSLKDVARNTGVDIAGLKELNPELRHGILPPDKYQLRIPSGKTDRVLAAIDQIPISSPPQRAYVYHKVRSGETLSTIARRYRTSVSQIMRANNLRKSNYIVAGKRLKIPQKGVRVARVPSPPGKGRDCISTHIVKSGDSLWIIAKRYDTTTKKIQAINNLYSTKLSIGQVLKIDNCMADVQEAGQPGLYLVRKGDSPFKIAKNHKMPLEHFLRINNLTPRSKIYPGQRLAIDK